MTKMISFVRSLCVTAIVSLLAQSVWAAEARVISINFNPSVSNHTKPVANDSTEVGLVPAPGSTWNDISETSLSSVSKELTVLNGETTAITMSIACRGSWHVDSATEAFRQHYLDVSTGSDVVNLTLANIPFAKYDVVLYSPYSTDQQPSTLYRPWKVNGSWWTTRDLVNGVAVPVAETDAPTSYWGGEMQAATWGVNAMRVCNQSSSTLTILGLNNNNARRAGPLAAIQIVEVLDTEVTVAGNTSISAINEQINGKDRIVVNLSNGAAVDFDTEPSANIDFVCSGSITLQAAAQPAAASLAKINIARVAGAVKRSWETLGAFGINFNSGSGSTKDQACESSTWQDVTEKTATKNVSTDGLTKVWWNASGNYNDGQSGNTFVKGYLDDGDANGVRIAVTGIPYDNYDVIVYATTDTDNAKLSRKNINGLDYTYDSADPQVAKKGTASWGSADSSPTVALGTNALRIRNQTASTFVLLSCRTANAERGCVSAIQIVPHVISDAAAKIGSTTYATVAEAIAAAQADSEIEILKDSSENLTLDRNVIFSVAQGESFTLSGTLGSNYNVTKKGTGTLAIKHNVDSGKIVDVVEGTLKLTTPNSYSMKGQLIVRAGAELVNMSTDAFGIDNDNVRADIYGTLNMNGTRWTLGRDNHTNNIYFYPDSKVIGLGQQQYGAFDNGQADQTNLHFVKHNGVGGEVTFNTEIRFRTDNGNNAGMEIEEGMTVNYINTVGFRSSAGTLNLTGGGNFKIASGASLTNLNALNVGSGVTATLASPAAFNGKSSTIAANGVLEFAPTANTDMGSYDLSGITGDGAIKFTTSNWIALPSGADKLFASTLEVVNEATNGLLLGDDTTFTIGPMSGSGKLRYDSGDGGARELKIVQTKDTTWTGNILAQGSTARELNIHLTSTNGSTFTRTGECADAKARFTVDAGATLRLEHQANGEGNIVVLNGGKLTTTGHGDAHGKIVRELRLTANSTFESTNDIFGIGHDSTASKLSLNDNTLTLTAPSNDTRVYLDKVTIATAGTINITKGHLFLHCADITAPEGTKLIVGADAVIEGSNRSITVSELVYNGTTTTGFESPTMVTATLKFSGTGSIPKLTLGDGTEVSGSATVTTTATAQGTVKLTDGAALTVPTAFTANTVKSGVVTKRVVETEVTGGIKYSLETIQPEPPTPTEEGVTPSIPGAETIEIVDEHGETVADGTIPLETGVYTVTGKVGETVVATETLGVIAAKDAEASADAKVTTAVAVPFTGATVKNLLNTALLTDEDTLMAYITVGTKSGYAKWTLTGGEWVGTGITGGIAAQPVTTALARGSAVWVTTAGKVVVLGKYDTTTEIAAPTTAETHLLANPTMEAYTPSAAAANDEVIIIGEQVDEDVTTVRYAKSADGWKRHTFKKVSNPFGGSAIGSKEVIDDAAPSVPVGKGFWFIKR